MGVDFWQAFVGVCIAGLQEVGDPDGVVRGFFRLYEKALWSDLSHRNLDRPPRLKVDTIRRKDMLG
jgi:hypothetical protein